MINTDLFWLQLAAVGRQRRAAALVGHCVRAAQALSAPGERSTTAAWLHSTARMTGIRIDSVHHCGGSEPYEVCTDFNYYHHWWQEDPSFPSGQEYWCYHPARRHGRWLIADDGLP
jgi:hypothetical protein